MRVSPTVGSALYYLKIILKYLGKKDPKPSRKHPATASSDRCFCLPFYPGMRRTAFVPSALPNDVNTPRGWDCAAGSGQDRRGPRGCTIRAGLGVSDLHSRQREENPPAADGAERSAARRAASPAGKGVFRGGESEPAGARMEAGGWRRR